MTTLQTEVQRLHARRLELLVLQDNFKSEIANKRVALKSVEVELEMVRHKLLGSELAQRDRENAEMRAAVDKERAAEEAKTKYGEDNKQ